MIELDDYIPATTTTRCKGELDAGQKAAVPEMLTAGYALVPIPLGMKGPQTLGWNTREKCCLTVDQAPDLTGLNVGLAHAYCTPTPTCAIDIDHYPSAKLWLATHGIDLNLLLTSCDAVVIWSGKKNSLKLLYRLPPGVPPLESKKINGLGGRCALEFRCATKEGKTVQDVLPPSLHPDGHRYRWVGAGDLCRLPAIPEDLLEVWQALIANTARVSRRGINVSSPRPETPRQIATVRDMLKHIDADCSYERWRNSVWSVLSTGWECAEDLAQEWSKTAPDRYDEDAFWLVAASYMPAHSSPITLGTVCYLAREGGWNG